MFILTCGKMLLPSELLQSVGWIYRGLDSLLQLAGKYLLNIRHQEIRAEDVKVSIFADQVGRFICVDSVF